MTAKKYINLFLLALLPVLDVATLLVIARFVGIFLTLVMVLLSTISGLLMCRRHLILLKEHSDHLKAQHAGQVPANIQLINANEGVLTFFLMLMFLFPGLLSDLIAFVLLIPRFQKGSVEWMNGWIRKEAERQGKTIEQLLAPKCSKTKA